MKPVNEWILVEKASDEEKSEGGIILPTTGSKNLLIKKSKVIAISKDVERLCKKDHQDLPYTVGSIVYHHSQTGIAINNDRDKFLLKYDSIMAVE